MNFTPFKIFESPNDRPLYPDKKSIFACKKCGSFELENDCYLKLNSLLDSCKSKFTNYINYRLANHRGAGNPKYNFLFLDFNCGSCNTQHTAFLYTRFQENYFPSVEREFLLAHVTNQNFEENVDGVYNRNMCQELMQKFFVRWYIMSKMTYVAVPFIGNTYQDAEQRIDLLNHFLTFLHPHRTLLITKTKTLNQIKKDINVDIGDDEGYQTIVDNNLLHPIIQNASRKQDFHAKFYCGLGTDNVEVLVGSHNLHAGKSMENLLFKQYSMEKFIERYILQLSIVPIPRGTKNIKTEALIFNRNDGLEVKEYKEENIRLFLKDYL